VYARAALSQALPGFGTTFAINILGAFLLGLLIETLGYGSGWRHILRLGLGTGLLGGFTTYATFSLEIVELWSAAPRLSVGYSVASLVAGVAAALGGICLAKRLTTTPASSGADA
jgi:CrcB protein